MDAVRSASRYQLDGSLGRWGLIAAAALARCLCVDAQTAKEASVQLIHMIGCWFEVQPKIAQIRFLTLEDFKRKWAPVLSSALPEVCPSARSLASAARNLEDHA